MDVQIITNSLDEFERNHFSDPHIKKQKNENILFEEFTPSNIIFSQKWNLVKRKI